MSKRPWGYQPRSERPEPNWTLDPQTEAVRAGLARSGFGETSEALYLTSGFTYTQAQEAEEAFIDETDHFVTAASQTQLFRCLSNAWQQLKVQSSV